MADREKLLYQNHVRTALIAIPGLLFDRVENSVACGTPDICYSYNGHHGWIELKVFDFNKANDRLLVSTLRGTQENWMRTRSRIGGGHVFCIAEIEGTVFIFEGPDVLAMKNKKMKAVLELRIAQWSRDAKPAEVAEILKRIL